MSIASQPVRRACVFAHYDARGNVADYVLYYLDALLAEVDQLIVVSTAALDESARQRLETRDLKLIVRENHGYDFYSYRAGIEQLDLDGFDELVLCNDSVFGPFLSLASLFQRAQLKDAELLGLTASVEVAFHLQSYFLVFRRGVFLNDDFQNFWRDLKPLNDKRRIIEEQEVGLTQFFASRGYRTAVLYDSDEADLGRRVFRSLGYYLGALRRRMFEKEFWTTVFLVLRRKKRPGVNPTHADWQYLLEDLEFPFVKIELLRDNPRQLKNVRDWPRIISGMGDYPLGLISDHLEHLQSVE